MRENSEEKYEILIQIIPDIIYEVDSNGMFTFISDPLTQLGYNPEGFIGRHFSIIVHPDDFEQVNRLIILPKYKGKISGDAGTPKLFDERRTGIRITRNLELRLVLKSQADTPVDYCYCEIYSSGRWDRLVTEKNKKFLGSIGVIRNITRRKIAERGLKETKNELEAVFSHLQKIQEQLKLFREKPLPKKVCKSSKDV